MVNRKSDGKGIRLEKETHGFSHNTSIDSRR
jgi:hypothetical protein